MKAIHKSKLLLLLLATVSLSARSAEKTYGDLPKAELVRVKDGDTFVVTVPSWPAIVGYEIPVRVRGINSPEIHSKRPENKKLAIKAKNFTSDALWQAKIITIKDIARDNFFRIDADVYVDGKSLAEMLLKAGLAKKYGEYWE